MNTHHYYDKNIKSNRLDCQYPNINKQAISDLVYDSVARYVYIYIYDEKGNNRTHWSYEVSFEGVRIGENYQKAKEKCLEQHIERICEYIEEDYKAYCESKEVTLEMMRREMINKWHFGLEFVNNLSSQEVKRIYELGPDGYREEIEEQEFKKLTVTNKKQGAVDCTPFFLSILPLYFTNPVLTQKITLRLHK